MQKNSKYLLLTGQALLISITPVFAWAQTFGSVELQLEGVIRTLVNFSIPVAGAFFVWGVVIMISNAGNETKRKQGINIIIYSLIGLVLIVSTWGIVTLLINAFGITGTIPSIPQIAPQTIPTS